MSTHFEKIINELSKWFLRLGGVSLLGMLCLACVNMFLRPLGHPYKGTYELVGFLGALTFAFPLGYSLIARSHISVDILATRYSKRTQRIMNTISSFVSLIFFALVAWRTALWATVIWKTGEKSETLRIIYHPFVYAVAICCGLLSFVLLIEFLKLLASEKGRRE